MDVVLEKQIQEKYIRTFIVNQVASVATWRWSHGRAAGWHWCQREHGTGGASALMPAVSSDLGVLGSLQLTWIVNEDGWHLCFILTTNLRPHRTAYISQKVRLVLTWLVLTWVILTKTDVKVWKQAASPAKCSVTFQDVVHRRDIKR